MSVLMVSFKPENEHIFRQMTERNQALVEQMVDLDYDNILIDEMIEYRDVILDNAEKHGELFEILDRDEAGAYDALIGLVSDKLGNRNIYDIMWRDTLHEKTIFDFYFAVNTMRGGKDEDLAKAVVNAKRLDEEDMQVVESACRKAMNVMEHAMKNRNKVVQLAIYDGQ